MREYRSIVMDNTRWEGFSFRDDDIVISTPPKCGTTWMQMMCALVLFQDPVLPQPLTELSPWLDVVTRDRDRVVAALCAQTHRRFIKSHTPLDGLPRDDRVTYICVGRDMRDAGVSWDNHMANLDLDQFIQLRANAVGLDDLAELMPDGLPVPKEDPVERFWEWVDADYERDAIGLQGSLRHLETFWQCRDEPNVALFHYTDMQRDLEGQMRRLAELLRVEVAEDLWPTLVGAAQFDQMRSRAADLAPQVTDSFWHSTDGFFKEGTSGKWQSFFGPGDQERYEARLRSLVAPDLADWVTNGWGGSPLILEAPEP